MEIIDQKHMKTTLFSPLTTNIYFLLPPRCWEAKFKRFTQAVYLFEPLFQAMFFSVQCPDGSTLRNIRQLGKFTFQPALSSKQIAQIDHKTECGRKKLHLEK